MRYSMTRLGFVLFCFSFGIVNWVCVNRDGAV